MQIHRLFEIVYILLERQTVTAAELAERFEVSSRTIYRDLETLSQAGIPIYASKGRGGGISLLPDFILNKAVLTAEEKQEILSSLHAFRALNLAGSETTLVKLTHMLGPRDTDWIEVDFSAWGYFQHDAANFDILKTAILEKRVATFLYASGKAEKLFREVWPLKLLFKGSAWYLYGFCTFRQDVRFFKLRRITQLTITDQHFNMSAPRHLITNQETDITTCIKTSLLISSSMAFRVYDEISSYSVNGNGDFLCELFLPDIDTVCTYASTFGAACTILSPQEAVEAMKRRLVDSLSNYI